MANKVKFGLSHCYFAPITVGNGGAVTYGSPVALPGAVSLNFAPSGDSVNFAADNVYNYYSSGGASNLSGDLEMALIGDDFKKAILGYVEDTNGALYISGSPTTKAFALLFQFEGDANAVRHVLYNCTATRPALNSNTTGETKEPVTETITVTASPAPDTNLLHAYLAESTDTAYTGWFSAVYTPAGV